METTTVKYFHLKELMHGHYKATKTREVIVSVPDQAPETEEAMRYYFELADASYALREEGWIDDCMDSDFSYKRLTVGDLLELQEADRTRIEKKIARLQEKLASISIVDFKITALDLEDVDLG